MLQNIIFIRSCFSETNKKQTLEMLSWNVAICHAECQRSLNFVTSETYSICQKQPALETELICCAASCAPGTTLKTMKLRILLFRGQMLDLVVKTSHIRVPGFLSELCVLTPAP